MLSARCAEQQRVLSECQEWQAETEQLHALLEHNSAALAALGTEAGLAPAAPAQAEAEAGGELLDEEAEVDEAEGEGGSELAALRQALLGREAQLEAAQELLEQRTAELAEWHTFAACETAAQEEADAEADAFADAEADAFADAEAEAEAEGADAEEEAEEEEEEGAEAEAGGQQLQVTRLKDEVQRMTTRARELGEFLEVEAEAAQLTQEELGKMGQQAAHLHTPARAPARTLHAHRHAHLCV